MLLVPSSVNSADRALKEVKEDRCAESIAITEIEPRAGLDFAMLWQSSGGGIPAAHCSIAALIGLGQSLGR